MRANIHWAILSIIAATAAAGPARAATACKDLKALALRDTTITLAEDVPAGEFKAPGVNQALTVPALCRVAGTVAPAIKFEVWLPQGAAWNGRLQSVGGGGLAGIISYPAMALAVRDGYASASTDTGHEASDSKWLLDRQRQTDYGYRAIHEMTVNAKAVVTAHYGRAAERAYFNGCSTGGRQGLMEAQRYPEDYDGIVSGAPVSTFTRLHMAQLWTAHATLKTPGSTLTREDLTLVTNAVLAKCDAADGVKDGVLTAPRSCDFKPQVLQCKAGATAGCLAPAKIKALEMVYAGPTNPRTGVSLYPGLEPGGEAPTPGNPGWALIMNGKGPFPIDDAVLGAMGFGEASWDWKSFDFDRDVDFVDAKLAWVLNAVNPDLRDFEARGSKLIIYHGWNDPGVMPQRTVQYYRDVIDYAGRGGRADGAQRTAAYARLFMMPGMGHCRGGNAPDQADWMGAISGWVEKGTAPDAITARREQDGKVTQTRPLCPFPQAARYRGNGSTDEARNFECAAPGAQR